MLPLRKWGRGDGEGIRNTARSWHILPVALWLHVNVKRRLGRLFEWSVELRRHDVHVRIHCQLHHPNCLRAVPRGKPHPHVRHHSSPPRQNILLLANLCDFNTTRCHVDERFRRLTTFHALLLHTHCHAWLTLLHSWSWQCLAKNE